MNMRFEQLNKLGTWYYHPTMESLKFFDATNGDKVAEWRLNAPHNVEWRRWDFYCVVNTLPAEVQYTEILSWWKLYVDSRLREQFN